MLAALSMGEPAHFARAAAFEVATSALDGTRRWKRTERLIAVATEAAKTVATPYATAWAEGSAGLAHYLRGAYGDALRCCLHAEEALREHGGATQWEGATLRIFAVSSLALLGRLDELALYQAAWVRDALDRGDLYAAVNLRIGFGNTARLVAGDPTAAREDVAVSMQQWSKQGTHVEHFYELIALTNADFYEGRPEEARARVLAQWRPMRRALLMTTVQSVRIHLWRMRAQATLAIAVGQTSDRAARLAEVGDAARRIERERTGWGAPFAKMLRAGIAGAEQKVEPAAALYEEAAQAADAAQMALVAAVARRCRGLLLGGDEGKKLVSEAEAWMRKMTVRSPERFAATIAPWVVSSIGAASAPLAAAK
jgi:hypothetical protein